MTGQRWFLTTPEQYAQAPVGTQVLDAKTKEEWECFGYGWELNRGYCWRVQMPGVKSEVKRWGTDADHQRACAALNGCAAR